jgi:hypothetical protein
MTIKTNAEKRREFSKGGPMNKTDRLRDINGFELGSVKS